MDPYLKLIEQIGEGAFSKLYCAYDFHLNKQVALKIEKNNKKQILKNEYDIYKSLQHLSCIPKIYNYIPNLTKEKNENNHLNCLEMELLGKNLLLFQKTFNYYNNILAHDIILQCLRCIQNIHNHGFIHRDIKPSNFCLHKQDEQNILSNYKNNIYFKNEINVYLIDFGLVKKINEKIACSNGNEEINNRRCFVGTLTYASMSAHNKEELSKKDDLWSFFFMILDLLNENLPWRNYSFEQEDKIIEIKQKCINDPEKYLFLTNTKNNKEIVNIFNYIKNLKFESEPDYEFIYNQLIISKNKEIQKIYYKYEINNQIMHLQRNLMIKNESQNQNLTNVSEEKERENINKSFNKISQQDYMIYKLSKTSNKSIPSLNSTNYSSSIYYKTNYINCLSSNNNENFYQSVLKLSSNNKNNNIYLNNVVNIHSYKYTNNLEENHEKSENLQKTQKNEKKIEKKYENDKSLIESLIGRKSESDDSSSVKSTKKENDKKNKKVKKRKMKMILNLHNKRKSIKFSIVKNEK